MSKYNSDFLIDLGIPTANALRDDFAWPTRRGPMTGSALFYPDATEILEGKWLEMLANLGIHPETAMIFNKGEGLVPKQAHVDIVREKGRDHRVVCALNWTIGGRGSTMSWYDETGAAPLANTTPNGYTGLHYRASELKELYRTSIPNDTLALVRTNIPHLVGNGPEERWCISLRVDLHLYSSWNDAATDMRNKAGC